MLISEVTYPVCCCQGLVGQYEMPTKRGEMTKTFAHGYSFYSSPEEISNEYQYDRVLMIFINLCLLVHWAR